MVPDHAYLSRIIIHHLVTTTLSWSVSQYEKHFQIQKVFHIQKNVHDKFKDIQGQKTDSLSRSELTI